MARPPGMFLKWFCELLLLGFLSPAALTQSQDARDSLNQGVRAFKDGQYEEATRLFQRAKDLDPKMINARLYLATVYATQYIPGAPSEENVRYGEKAMAEFKEVLQMEPDNLSAMDGAGAILYNMAGTPFDPAKFEESRNFHKKHIETKPADPEPYYWVGLIDWTLAFRANNKLRTEYNQQGPHEVRDIDPLPGSLLWRFVHEYGAIVDDGIKHLKKAIELKEDYEDAFAYLNLLYRQKADMVASSEERDKYFEMADEQVEHYKKIKEKKMKNEAPRKP